MKKIITISLALMLGAVVQAEDTTRVISLGIPQVMGMGLSPDAQYVCGAIDRGDGMFVYNLKTDESKYVQTVDENEGALLIHVDNKGTAIGYDGPGVTYSISGTRTELYASAEYKYVLGEDISQDGKILCGSLVGAGFLTQAAVFRDGKWEALPKPPEDIQAIFGKVTSAKYMSGDGKYILGRLGSIGPGILWVRNDQGNYEIDPIYSKFVILTQEELAAGEKSLLGLFSMDISNNGKYACFRGTIMNDKKELLNVPVVYDIEAGEIKIYDEPQQCDENGMGLTPNAIADDGTFVGNIGTPLTGSYGSYIMKAGDTQGVLFNDAFPSFVKELGEADSYGFNTPTSLSADGRYVLGYAWYSDDYDDVSTPAFYKTYVIDRGEEYAAVNEISSGESAGAEAIYSIDGNRLGKMTKGINIIRMSDGSVRKVMK